MEHLENAKVSTKANVFFDGRCVSHTVTSSDGSRKSVGVILPGPTLTFNIGAPEIMQTVEGSARVKIAGGDWQTMNPGDSFEVPENGSFDIEVDQGPYHYICHFG